MIDSSFSWTDLLFTTPPNLVVESGVHIPLHPNCYYHLSFAKFNLQVYYPTPYPRKICHNKQANTEFLNTNVNAKVSIFSSTIINILSNFIFNETIVCNDKDPPWLNRAIKSLIQEKKRHSINTAKAKITSSYCNT